jgi:hypothetical protein
MTTVQTTEYNGGTTTVTTTTISGGGFQQQQTEEVTKTTKTMGIIELAIGAACAVLAIATIIFSWVYLDARLDATTLSQYNGQCKNQLGNNYVGQVCQAVVCSTTKICPTDTTTGDAMYCGTKDGATTCLPCPYSVIGKAQEGKNYVLNTLQTLECTQTNLEAACAQHCRTQKNYKSATVTLACETQCKLSSAEAQANIEHCQGKLPGASKFESKNSCGGYPWDFDQPPQNNAPTYQGNKNLIVCGRPMYAAVCYNWGDQYQLTGDTGVQQSTIDTTPLGLLKNYKYGGGIPSTVAASLALVVAIPAIINGLMAMQGNEGGVKATGGLAIGFSIIGFCTTVTCLIIVCVLYGTAQLVEYLFAIFDGVTAGDSCPTGSACYKSVQEQASLSTVVSYYFRVLSFMVGFLFAISILQSIFAVVVCCAFKRQGQ